MVAVVIYLFGSFFIFFQINFIDGFFVVRGPNWFRDRMGFEDGCLGVILIGDFYLIQMEELLKVMGSIFELVQVFMVGGMVSGLS